MDNININEFIKDAELFRTMSNEELAIIAPLFEIQHYKEKEEIFVENSDRNYLYIVYQGNVDLYKINLFGKETMINFFVKGNSFGESTILDNYPHSTNARAQDETILLGLHRTNIELLFANNTTISTKLVTQTARLISRRIRRTTNQVSGPGAQYASGKTRLEHDLLGDREVPYEYYYGIQTLRALENFNISGVSISHYPNLIKALAQVKMAAALANKEIGELDGAIANAIVQACIEIANGKYHIHFVVDVFQGGAGTSTNMNANEVIANRALEILGHEKGNYKYCHPNNHVNLAQSTNDAYPTALKIAMLYSNQAITKELKLLIDSFRNKAHEFANIIKMGRTQLQDAVPMTLGQEFEAYAMTLEEEIMRLNDNSYLFYEVNMGGTAIGTGLNANPKYKDPCVKYLANITGMPIVLAANLVEATQDTGSYVMYSSAIKRLAIKLSKICNDLRLLSSGPRAGFNEINLPKMQPGSSIMPGKVNPVIPEVVNQIAFKVIGNDLTVAFGAEAGQLQLNVMEPVIAQSIFESLELLSNGMSTLRLRCIDGITANEDVCKKMVENSIGVITALNPVLGYEKCTELAKEALEQNASVYELIISKGYLTREQLDTLLSPMAMAVGN